MPRLMSSVPSPSGDTSPATTLRISTALISSDQFELMANVFCSPAPQVKSASAAALESTKVGIGKVVASANKGKTPSTCAAFSAEA